MKTITKLLFISLLTTISFVNGIAAQETGSNPAVIEIFACNFNGNNDLDDLLTVSNKWNKWADTQNVNNYTAIILTPYVYSDELPYDVLWLGVYPNGAAMAAGESLWFAEGQKILADFEKVTDCTSHSHFVGNTIHVPASPPGDNGLAAFSDCSISDDYNLGDVMSASGRWSEYLSGKQIDSFASMITPAAGLPSGISYDYKSIQAFDSLDMFGQYIDLLISGGGGQKAGEIFDSMVSCNSPRVYFTNIIRLPQQEQPGG